MPLTFLNGNFIKERLLNYLGGYLCLFVILLYTYILCIYDNSYMENMTHAQFSKWLYVYNI